MSLVLRGATLIDGTGRDPVADATVVVEEGRITRVGGDAPRAAEALDLGGLTLMPGLIDAHVHLAACVEGGLGFRHSVAEIASAMFDNCAQTLEAGFTTVRDTGGVDAGIVGVVDSGRVKGPRIICCGPLLCQTGGHGHFASDWEPTCLWHHHEVLGLTTFSLLSDGVDEIRKNAREAFRRGARFLKLCVTGGVVSKTDALTDTQFSVGEIRAAVEEAKARGTYVTVHAHNNEGIRNAVEAGVECVEHGTRIDEATARLMADRGVNLVPTLAVAHTMLQTIEEFHLPKEIAARAKEASAGMNDAILAARAAGVPIGSGSDLIGPNQTYRGLELVLKSEVIGPMEALVSATKTNAEIIGVGDRLGTVEGGKLADLIAIDGNPLDKPELWNDRERIPVVLKGGAVVKDTRA